MGILILKKSDLDSSTGFHGIWSGALSFLPSTSGIIFLIALVAQLDRVMDFESIPLDHRFESQFLAITQVSLN